MKRLSSLLIVSARQLLGNPHFTIQEWQNFSRCAYVEPILVRDGYHDYVLMGAPDYEEMQAVFEGLEPHEVAAVKHHADLLRSQKRGR